MNIVGPELYFELKLLNLILLLCVHYAFSLFLWRKYDMCEHIDLMDKLLQKNPQIRIRNNK